MVPIQYRPSGRSAKEISDSIESGIRRGALSPADLMPSVRALADELAVSPGTVAAAYKLLAEHGLVESRGRSGTYVRARPPLAVRSTAVPLAADVVDLASGAPDPALLPAIRWPSTGGPAVAPTGFVTAELEALARERLAADGIAAEAITLSSGGLDGIQRVLSVQLRPGDLVGVEDPGWPNALDLVPALGLRAYPLPCDGDGPRTDGLKAALQAGARAVIITSRAQNPTGGALAPARAAELRGVLAAHPQTLVIEDDHAAELAGVPLVSLSGATTSWAFIRSTSKPYGPDLRLALLAGDEATLARVEGRMRVGSGWVSSLVQQLVVALWTSTEVASVVAGAAEAYSERRDRLIAELAERGVIATGRTGLNVWVPVADETAVVANLLQNRWAVAPGARFRQVSGPGVRITVSRLTVEDIPRLADQLASALVITPASTYTV